MHTESTGRLASKGQLLATAATLHVQEKYEGDALVVGVSKACQMLSVSNATLYRLISAGHLETVLINRRRLVNVASIRALAATGNRQ